MSSIVCFRTAGSTWAVEVDHARRVRRAAALVQLPEPRPGVAGLLTSGGEAPLPVLSALGASTGEHVLELEAGGRRFGLLVDEVTGVIREEQVGVGPAPEGQQEDVVCGVVVVRGETVLLIDAEALARRAGLRS